MEAATERVGPRVDSDRRIGRNIDSSTFMDT